MRTLENTLLVLRSESNGSDYVSINPKTKKPYTDLKNAFGTACRLAGIRDLHWHDLRHTFGTRLAEVGCSEATIASLMGTLIRKPRADTHTPQTALNERLLRPCVCCAKMFATNLPQQQNGCQSGSRNGDRKWSGRLDSNQRPHAPQACALPGCATSRVPDFLSCQTTNVKRAVKLHLARPLFSCSSRDNSSRSSAASCFKSCRSSAVRADAVRA